MAKLSVAVMAHRSRAHLVPDLVERLGIDPEQVIWDRNNDRWDTGRRAWEAHDSDATHHIVIQDDAMVCRDMPEALEGGLDYVPDNAIVSPYVGTRRPMVSKVEHAVKTAEVERAAWIIMRGLNWGVGILAPTAVIPEMLPWCDRQRYPNYDRRVGRYFLEVLQWPTWCTWPSLIDHRPVPSLCGHGGGRHAHQFLGEETSALNVDFGAGHVTMSTPKPVGSVRKKRSVRSPIRRAAPVNVESRLEPAMYASGVMTRVAAQRRSRGEQLMEQLEQLGDKVRSESDAKLAKLAALHGDDDTPVESDVAIVEVDVNFDATESNPGVTLDEMPESPGGVETSDEVESTPDVDTLHNVTPTAAQRVDEPAVVVPQPAPTRRTGQQSARATPGVSGRRTSIRRKRRT